MKSLISDGLGRLNAVTGKHSVSNKLSLVALMTLGLTLLFLAASGGNLMESEIRAKQESGYKNKCSDTKHNKCGNVASSLPATILDYVSVVDHGLTHSQQQNKGQEKAKGGIDWVEIEAFRLARENLKSQKVVSDSTVTLTRYTKLTFWAAVGSLLISAFGMFFIWKTLTAANRANTIARESLEISNRAYIGSDTSSRVEEIDGETRIYTKLKNFGNTPALRCVCAGIGGYISTNYESQSRDTIFVYPAEFSSGGSSVAGGSNPPPMVAPFFESKDGYCYFVATIFIYDTVFGNTIIYFDYRETIRFKNSSHTSLWERDAPQEIQEQVDAAIAVELERRTNHTQLSLRG